MQGWQCIACPRAHLLLYHHSQVEKSVADLSRQAQTLRTLLSPKAAAAAAKAMGATVFSQQYKGSQGGTEKVKGPHLTHTPRQHAMFDDCGFSVAQLEGVMALDEIEQLVAQVRGF